MALLNFKGKSAVWNHHLSVPYQTLEKDKKQSVKGKNENENLIIEADNLVALKSLLPKYQGKIKCVYIDPPYNTGNEGWVYSDSVSSPLIKEWLGKAIDKEDMTRHDKWLCMMTPRLKLLHELLAENGVIFISIDDNEVHNLRNVMNEIFEERNFISQIVWRRRGGGGSDSMYFSTEYEYILCYLKNRNNTDPFNIDYTVEQKKRFGLKDYKGQYYLKSLIRPERLGARPNLQYSIKCPDSKVIEFKSDGSKYTWVVSKGKFEEMKKNNEIAFQNKKNKWSVYRKVYLESRTPSSLFFDVALNREATKEAVELFGSAEYFSNPKPINLVKHLLNIGAPKKEDIILDSFAGSGTTAHAIMDLNKEDGGNRKFILVQLPEKIDKKQPAYKAGYRFVHEITRDRVKKAIQKNKYDVGFSYMKLGPKIDADSILVGDLPIYKDFAKYVYYLATGKTLDNEKNINEKSFFVGKSGGEAVYLIYEKNMDKLKSLAITLEWAKEISKKDKGKKVVYAPACFLDDENLERFNISFVAIPYNLFERS